MRSFYNRCCYYCSYYLRNFWRTSKVRFIIAIIIGVIGITIGITVALATDAEPNTVNYIVLMSRGEYSIFGAFIKHLLLCAALYALIFVGVFHRYLKCIGYVILFIFGYSFGAGMVAVIVENTALGVIYIIIFTIPQSIVTLIMLSVLICMVSNYLGEHGNYSRCSAVCRGNIKKICIKFLYAFLLQAMVILIFMVLIPCIAHAIIVV